MLLSSTLLQLVERGFASVAVAHVKSDFLRIDWKDGTASDISAPCGCGRGAPVRERPHPASRRPLVSPRTCCPRKRNREQSLIVPSANLQKMGSEAAYKPASTGPRQRTPLKSVPGVCGARGWLSKQVRVKEKGRLEASICKPSLAHLGTGLATTRAPRSPTCMRIYERQALVRAHFLTQVVSLPRMAQKGLLWDFLIFRNP